MFEVGGNENWAIIANARAQQIDNNAVLLAAQAPHMARPAASPVSFGTLQAIHQETDPARQHSLATAAGFSDVAALRLHIRLPTQHL
jgi:hypothetical protein